MFCVYEADSEDLIREHGKITNMIITEIVPMLQEIQHDTSGE